MAGAALADELGQDPGEVFKSIDPEPLASASLAQAHAAWRADGTTVILKIQRPGIDEQVTRDLDMIRRLTRRAESQSELARTYHVADLGRGFADALAEELDFRIEARNIAVIAAAAPADATVLIPAVHTDISSRRLLVLERFDGISIRDALGGGSHGARSLCGPHGVVCYAGPNDPNPGQPTGMCCWQGQICGGGWPVIGCPKGACCWVGTPTRRPGK